MSQLLIKNVTIADVENKKLLTGYDVTCSEGKIVSIEKHKPGKVIVANDTIDGTGKFLIPGLTDAHVHFFQSGGLFARPDAIDLRKHQPYADEIKWTHNNMEDFLRRYTATGITAVVDVGATYNILQQRDSFKNKEYAPLISMTGPLLTTYVPEPFKKLGADAPFLKMETAEGVRASVKEQIQHKADFIKIWYIVTDQDKEAGARKNLSLVKAAIDEAHANHLRVAVHATERITAQLAVEAGADFLVHNVDDEIVSDEFVQLLKRKKTVLCPTMVVADGYYRVFNNSYGFTAEELAISNPQQVASILDFYYTDSSISKALIKTTSAAKYEAFRKHSDSISLVNLMRLYKGGVCIATGTDAGNIGTHHAGSYFNELQAMQQAGFNGWDLLQASTINGAKAVGEEKEWGSIAKGKNANMILLDANPVDSITNWRKINSIINKGKVLKPGTILLHANDTPVQEQLNAYNAHNLEAFLEPYAEEVEVYSFPGKLMIKGKKEMREEYRFITKTAGLHCVLLNRIKEGNMIIDHEEIHVNGRKPFNGIAIYIVENGKITKVYFPE
ncbi:MAG: amidohydrolase family protein [Bacteroidetes bacterium]|nr:amidohydrolase family protein [Bacteroidota bacterium]